MKTVIQLILALLWGFVAPRLLAAEQTRTAVTVSETSSSFTLANEVLTARVDKRTGRLSSLLYKGRELLSADGGYWSQVGRGIKGLGATRESALRISPHANGGERAEVACKFGYDGKPGSLPVDVEMRYALGRGESGLHAYAVWVHPRGYPAFSLGEARYALKLNPEIFDHLTVDANRRRIMPSGEDWDRGSRLNLKEARRLTTGLYAGEVEHKYDYSAVLSETPAYGWSSSKDGVGLWIINPSMEYVAGGPTKVELTGHLDVNSGGHPTLLNMWLGSHYGGSVLSVGQDEAWAKVIGPFVIYCNEASGPDALWRDALGRAAKESRVWPYTWVSDRAYPPGSDRATVGGQVLIRDERNEKGATGVVWVGLSAPDYPVSARRGGAVVDWQREGKYYQFWSAADAQGRFELRNVRPGNYTLHAFAGGVLGEFARTNITVTAGQRLDLGAMTWRPERRGRQLWEIGIPDRSAAEFRHGDHYWKWGLYHRYQEEFPNGVNFVIGQSDWRRDWNYAQPPRIAPDGKVSDSVWKISFDLAEVPSGPVTLRLAFCGSRAGSRVSVIVNDQPVGDTGELPDTAVMHRDGIRGYWFERQVTFEPSHLRKGINVLQLRSRAEVWHQGVLYDYLRLEAVDAMAPEVKPGT